ncbi:hypothetical protein D3C86_1712880 [compost metagenome]
MLDKRLGRPTLGVCTANGTEGGGVTGYQLAGEPFTGSLISLFLLDQIVERLPAWVILWDVLQNIPDTALLGFGRDQVGKYLLDHRAPGTCDDA